MTAECGVVWKFRVWSPALSNDAFPYGVENYFRPAMQIQFLHDVTAMGLHRVRAQIVGGGEKGYQNGGEVVQGTARTGSKNIRETG